MQNHIPLGHANNQALPHILAVTLKGLALLGTIMLSSGCANIMATSSGNTVARPGAEITDATTLTTYSNAPTLMSQRISGKVLGDDGKTPLEGATVYIANYNPVDSSNKQGKRMINDMSLSSLSSSSLTTCEKPVEAVIAMACSRFDGSFELTIPQISQLPLPLVFIKDGKKVEVAIDLNDLGTNIGTVAFDFPEPQHSNVAIVLDLFNPYEDIRSQLKTRQFNAETAFLDLTKQLSDVFNITDNNTEISFPDLQSLFEDSDKDGNIDIFNYDVVYINSRNQADVAKLDKAKKQALLKYISRGGQLYITEWTIELPEIPLDQYI